MTDCVSYHHNYFRYYGEAVNLCVLLDLPLTLIKKRFWDNRFELEGKYEYTEEHERKREKWRNDYNFGINLERNANLSYDLPIKVFMQDDTIKEMRLEEFALLQAESGTWSYNSYFYLKNRRRMSILDVIGFNYDKKK